MVFLSGSFGHRALLNFAFLYRRFCFFCFFISSHVVLHCRILLLILLDNLRTYIWHGDCECWGFHSLNAFHDGLHIFPLGQFPVFFAFHFACVVNSRPLVVIYSSAVLTRIESCSRKLLLQCWVAQVVRPHANPRAPLENAWSACVQHQRATNIVIKVTPCSLCI